MTEKEFISTLYPVLNKLRDYYAPKILEEQKIIDKLTENDLDPSNHFNVNTGKYVDYYDKINILNKEWDKQRNNIIRNARRMAREKGILVIPDLQNNGLPDGVIDCWGSYTR
jgi:hypothetical protein